MSRYCCSEQESRTASADLPLVHWAYREKIEYLLQGHLSGSDPLEAAQFIAYIISGLRNSEGQGFIGTSVETSKVHPSRPRRATIQVRGWLRPNSALARPICWVYLNDYEERLEVEWILK